MAQQLLNVSKNTASKLSMKFYLVLASFLGIFFSFLQSGNSSLLTNLPSNIDVANADYAGGDGGGDYGASGSCGTSSGGTGSGGGGGTGG